MVVLDTMRATATTIRRRGDAAFTADFAVAEEACAEHREVVVEDGFVEVVGTMAHSCQTSVTAKLMVNFMKEHLRRTVGMLLPLIITLLRL